MTEPLQHNTLANNTATWRLCTAAFGGFSVSLRFLFGDRCSLGSTAGVWVKSVRLPAGLLNS